ncbi:uncharacterized protein YALI1_F30296g [Yarrowia lipolytica]|uniref:Uncharacterized protein n=1 Tax=Yarrowia lipolytica TaxID=4952 RepID=A0A1D8NPM8_YARLL|nr:hypothetical protein YALI1_F30296g [Yarrowia lipolytica]
MVEMSRTADVIFGTPRDLQKGNDVRTNQEVAQRSWVGASFINQPFNGRDSSKGTQTRLGGLRGIIRAVSDDCLSILASNSENVSLKSR